MINKEKRKRLSASARFLLLSFSGYAQAPAIFRKLAQKKEQVKEDLLKRFARYSFGGSGDGHKLNVSKDMIENGFDLNWVTVTKIPDVMLINRFNKP